MKDKLDKALVSVQEDYVEEIEPITLAAASVVIGGIATIGLLISYLITVSIWKMQFKKSIPLSGRINKILNENKWNVLVLPVDFYNAFAIGGKTIFLTEKLIKDFPPREVDAIMLHEVFHNKKWHIQKNILSKFPLFSIAFFITATLYSVVFLPFLVFFISCKLLEIPYKILIGRKFESDADAFAVKMGYGEEMKSALERLESIYLKQKNQAKCGPACKLIEKIDNAIDEHPPLKTRIEDILKHPDFDKTMKNPSYKKIKDFVFKAAKIKEN